MLRQQAWWDLSYKQTPAKAAHHHQQPDHSFPPITWGFEEIIPRQTFDRYTHQHHHSPSIIICHSIIWKRVNNTRKLRKIYQAPGENQIHNPLSSSFDAKHCATQGAKKVIFTACHSGKLKLAITSPNIISTSPQIFCWAELISQFFCKLNSSKYFTCSSGKLTTEFTSLIAKSTSPGLSDTTFFARCYWRLRGEQGQKF